MVIMVRNNMGFFALMVFTVSPDEKQIDGINGRM
ncbi:hypothetical protein PC116_g29373 [Phytophthora cactorum]|nr:hypothetical protein PC116_g29373 [Phytophthora cactorum]